MTAHEFYNKLKSLNIEQMKETAVVMNKETIINLNKIQLREGETSKGNLIVPSYSLPYWGRKKKMSSYKAPTMTPDLYLTGDFHGSIDMVVDGMEYDLIAWDEKYKWLARRYKNILGLNIKSINSAKAIITNTFNILVKNSILT